MLRKFLLVPAAIITSAGLAVAGVLAHSGTFGLNIILRHVIPVWVNVEPNDQRLSASMRLALQDKPPVVRPGPFKWQQLDRGFDVGELPVMADNVEVDRILLARIDPDRFKFQVRTRSSDSWDGSEWMDKLGAVLVTNGSYFTRNGMPATPILNANRYGGPKNYDAKHGAFVASRSFAGIRDLANLDWQDALRDADDGMVSYPMLIGDDGLSRSKGNSRWLANRTFVAEAHDGSIILGTTKDAFFSLDRLAEFLTTTPLRLKLALNLDGGPVACQMIKYKNFERDQCGQYELATHDGKLQLLRPLIGSRRWPLPIVLAVLPR